eukprot:GHRR01017476.1.p1 GENE.GHRR01017476.1~~GHRR01017476.1.p1  ORF type:complete len:252 (+),score=42.79 GHRR01017476.1:272-1027(+)
MQALAGRGSSCRAGNATNLLSGTYFSAVRRPVAVKRAAVTRTAASQVVPVSSSDNNGTAAADNTGVLLVQCPDAKGVVAALAQLLFGFNCNIVQSDQFTDETLTPSCFFQRIHFDFRDISVGTGNLAVLERAVADLAKRYEMDWKVSYRPKRKRMAVLVSKMDHCLFDLLIRQRSGELPCDIPVVISNHPDLSHVAGMFGVDFEHLGFRADLDRPAAKQHQEAAIQKVGSIAAIWMCCLWHTVGINCVCCL